MRDSRAVSLSRSPTRASIARRWTSTANGQPPPLPPPVTPAPPATAVADRKQHRCGGEMSAAGGRETKLMTVATARPACGRHAHPEETSPPSPGGAPSATVSAPPPPTPPPPPLPFRALLPPMPPPQPPLIDLIFPRPPPPRPPSWPRGRPPAAAPAAVTVDYPHWPSGPRTHYRQ